MRRKENEILKKRTIVSTYSTRNISRYCNEFIQKKKCYDLMEYEWNYL